MSICGFCPDELFSSSTFVSVPHLHQARPPPVPLDFSRVISARPSNDSRFRSGSAFRRRGKRAVRPPGKSSELRSPAFAAACESARAKYSGQQGVGVWKISAISSRTNRRRPPRPGIEARSATRKLFPTRRRSAGAGVLLAVGCFLPPVPKCTLAWLQLLRNGFGLQRAPRMEMDGARPASVSGKRNVSRGGLVKKKAGREALQKARLVRMVGPLLPLLRSSC